MHADPPPCALAQGVRAGPGQGALLERWESRDIADSGKVEVTAQGQRLDDNDGMFARMHAGRIEAPRGARLERVRRPGWWLPDAVLLAAPAQEVLDGSG